MARELTKFEQKKLNALVAKAKDKKFQKQMQLATGKTGEFSKVTKRVRKPKTGPITKGEIARETIKGLPKAAGIVARAIGGNIGLSSMRRPMSNQGLKKAVKAGRKVIKSKKN